MEKSFVIAYIVFFILAAVSVGLELELDHWLALATNGALAVTAVLVYPERVDISVLSLTVLCTSLVWHSSAKLQNMDGFLSRLLGYYAFASSAFSLKIAGPISIILAYVLTFESEIEEWYLAGPLLGCLVIYRLWNKTFSVSFALALLFGGLGFTFYIIESWHAMWHVLGAVAVALTVKKVELSVAIPIVAGGTEASPDIKLRL